MDRKLKERLVGAAVIVAVAVVFVPEFLSGRDSAEMVTSSIRLPVVGDREIKAHTIDLAPPETRTAPPAPIPTKSLKTSKPETSGTLPAAPVEQARAPAAAHAEDGEWSVQLGSFSSRENAEKLARQAGARGFDVEVSVHQAGERVMHRVRTAPLEGRAAAEALAEKLGNAGHQGRVVPHP